MLEEVGAEYEQVIVEYGPKMKAADYMAINPMGKVPAIVHGDKTVTECAAICAYLADVFPDAGLAPPVDQRAEYYRWLFFTAGPLESAVFNKNAGFEVSEEQQRMIGYGNYELTLSAIDQLLSESDYVCGDRFTAADVYLGSQIDWGLMFKTITPTPSFEAYAERMRARPDYKKAKAIDAALMPKD
jgi:glutathione S-transferase